MSHPTLESVLKKHGITISPGWGGEFQRAGSQWFRGLTLKVGDKVVQLALFGDFARNLSTHWRSEHKCTAAEEKAIHEAISQVHEENRAERLRHWELVRHQVNDLFRDASTIGESPYFKRKGLVGLYGCRLEAHERGTRTLVPAYDVDGVLWGFQRIYSEKLSLAGTDKIFCEGARKEGCFHTLGQLETGEQEAGKRVQPGVIYLAEGIATAITIFDALGGLLPVVSCFDAGNLVHVAPLLRARFPQTRFVFCADNDQWPAKDGRVYHTGRAKAERAASLVGNAHVVLPQFLPSEVGGHPTDFDDLRRLRGLEEVKRQVLAQPAETSKDKDKDLGPLRPLQAKNKAGEPTKPGERSVALELLKYYGDKLLVQNRDVFLYGAGHWQHQGEDGVKRIKKQLAHLYGPKAGSRDFENAYKYFITHAPCPPNGVDLFVPQFWSANFSNGTLHFRPKPGGSPDLDWRPHNAADWHITQLPFQFPGFDRLDTKNSAFEEMLDRIWLGDPDASYKRRALAQLMGACLMPCYTKVFFLVGKRGSGKSTIIKLINRLIDSSNVSRVDPSHFQGFNMETMVGKLVNMDPDINLHKPIHDDIIKKIIDRIPFRVARKFQTDLLAPLPPIHIFGGNDLPQSMEGATGAYERRVIILRFGAFSAEALGTAYDLDFDEQVWAAGPEGIIAFALKGLIDLVSLKGHFTVPPSSHEALKEWDDRSDILGQFLDALEHKELDEGNQFKVGEDLKIKRQQMWVCFDKWQHAAYGQRAPWNPKVLCNALRNRGFVELKIKGVRYWKGIGLDASSESAV